MSILGALKRTLGFEPLKEYILHEGRYYDPDKWEKVPDPSDWPPPDWRPPNGDWNNWKPDMILRRKDRRT